MSFDPPTKLHEAQERYPMLKNQVFKFTNTPLENSETNFIQSDSKKTPFNFNDSFSKYQNDMIIIACVFGICAFGLWYWKPSFICEKSMKKDGSVEYVYNYKYIVIISIVISIGSWYVYTNHILNK